MSKSDNEHDQKQEHKSSVYEFFVSFPSLGDDTNCSEEIPVAERSAVGNSSGRSIPSAG